MSLAFGDVDAELERTRKVLERIPGDRLAWRPHEKSMPLGQLGAHLVNLLYWQHVTIERDSFDIASVPPLDEGRMPKGTSQLLDTFDRHVERLRDLMGGLDEASLTATWTLLMGARIVFAMPRAMVLRMGFQHMAHHRGQMTVYFRLLDVPVPSTYGPTADES